MTRPTPLNQSAIDPRPSIRAELLDVLLDEHAARTLPRLQRLWRYYRNDLSTNPAIQTAAARPDRPGTHSVHTAQARGLPGRLQPKSTSSTALPSGQLPQREVVIENDIAWRIHSLVDFMAPAAPAIHSLAEDPQKAAAIDALLGRTFQAAGGHAFFQNLSLLGGVYGFVDVLVHVNVGQSAIELQTVEPTRAVPLLNPDDYRRLDAYLVHSARREHRVETPGFFSRVGRKVLPGMSGGDLADTRSITQRTTVWTAQRIERYVGSGGGLGDGRKRVSLAVNRLGRVPVVHIQNLPIPFSFSGLSDVEPLIPLQDELNTRLSDRANRLTFQAFKMYLGIGIEQFHDRPIGPGQMWSSSNPEARIQEFGGDAASPSEDAHIGEIRDAMDKASGVPPVAAGIVRDKVGNLTSENALRIVLMGLLAKTRKKRAVYGAGIERLCELILHAADVFGLLTTRAEQRQVRLDWPEPMPADESKTLADAERKLELGVPQAQVLAELGYQPEAAS